MRNQLLVTAMAMLVGCDVGEVSSGGGGGPDAPGIDPNATARQVFDQRIYPLLASKCAGSTCHSESNTANGPFVASVASEGYAKANTSRLVGDYSNNPPILAKIAGGHPASYNDADKASIQAWLAKEVAERGQTVDLLRTWSGCMTVEDFRATNMAQACGNQRTINDNGGSRCKTCHVNGGNRHVASDVEGDFWPRISEDRNYLSKYFTVDEVAMKVIVNESNFNDYANGKHNHELFDMNGQGLQAMRAFHEATMRHVTADECGQPRI